jgi:hypothetical protein
VPDEVCPSHSGYSIALGIGPEAVVVKKKPATGVHIILELLLLRRCEPAGLPLVGRIHIAFFVVRDILAPLSAKATQINNIYN